MRKLVLLTLGFIPGIIAMGQVPRLANPGDKKPKHGYDSDCVHRNTYTQNQLLDHFPFKVADTIKLVSFRYHNNNYPVRKNHITSDSLIEQLVLSKSEVIQLADLIYNVGLKKYTGIGSVNQCFFPRNAVLFIDKTGKLQAYALICFHCRRVENYADDMSSWDDCDQKVDMINKFFISAGIKFGTDPTKENYPGEGCDDCVTPPPLPH